MKMIDLLALDYVTAGIYFTNFGHYLFAEKDGKELQVKWLAQPDVARAFSGVDLDSGWISPDIIRTGIGVLGAWYVIFKPAGRVKAIIQKTKGKTVVNMPAPALVMMGNGRNYYIWAMTGKDFDPEAKAMQAPFPNVNSDGHICFGSNVVPPASIDAAGKVWKLFWDAPFNHDQDNGKSRKYSDDITKLLVTLDGVEEYPVDDMVPDGRGRTINQVIEDVLKRGNR